VAVPSNAADPAAELKERFARQIILPGVGVEGQKKWAETPIGLYAEATVLEAASTALTSSGASQLTILKDSRDAIPAGSVILVLTPKKDVLRAFSRRFRSEKRAAFLGWPSGSGWALFLASHRGGQCPCLECFEVMNPKAFNEPVLGVPRLMAAMGASEVLRYILEGGSSLEGKVWITSLDSGISFQHEVAPSYKCPAKLMEEGAPVTP